MCAGNQPGLAADISRVLPQKLVTKYITALQLTQGAKHSPISVNDMASNKASEHTFDL
jgi:hypothetical protein